MNLNEIRENFYKRVKSLENLISDIEIPKYNFDFLSKIINKTTFDIAVIGEFTSGKSTLINALIGLDLLPTLLQPTTARITFISFSEKQKIILNQNDGKSVEKDFDPKFLKELIADNSSLIESIDTIEVKLTNNLLNNGIVLIDTPGTNDTDEQRVKITYGVIPTADAVIYVTVHPVTASNIEVFKEHILGNKIKNLFIVVNKIDLLGNDIDKAIANCKENFNNLLDYPIENIYAISALDYLDGLLNEDKELIEKSRFQYFKNALNDFLISSEKYNNLKNQYDAIFEKSKIEIIDLIKLKASSLQLPEDLFQEQKETLRKELLNIKEKSKEVEKQVEREFDRLYLKIQDSLNNLLFEILETIDNIFQKRFTDFENLKREIEYIIKTKYENWLDRNQPIVDDYIKSIREEISIRVASSVDNVSTALTVFNSNLAINIYENNNSQIYKILKDDSKSYFLSTATVVAGMFVLSTVGIFPPLAFLLGPLMQNFRKNLIEKHIEQLKPSVISSIQDNFQKFRSQFLSNLSNIKNNLIENLDKLVNSKINNINDLINSIEQERKNKKLEIEATIKNYEKIIEKIRNI
ncbi:MAG: dynamin family protein [Ignavibacterium sp.]|nr:dynamin family protein [Ignavibacterium sp.]